MWNIFLNACQVNSRSSLVVSEGLIKPRTSLEMDGTLNFDCFYLGANFQPFTIKRVSNFTSRIKSSFNQIQREKIGEDYLSRLAVRNGKKNPGQETGLGNRGRLKVLNDTKLILVTQDSFKINLLSFQNFKLSAQWAKYIGV